MTRSVRWALTVSAVTAVAMLAAACGSDDGGGGGGGGSGGDAKDGSAIKSGKKGGLLTYLAASDIDYLDPGQEYYTFGAMVGYSTNRTLYAFKPDDSVKPVPDLATGPPEISADNKTITVHVRTGVKYAPPVNREVKAADIKYAFERAFSQQVPNGYAGTYFNAIVGTPDKPNSGDIKPISGIETPDDSTLVFRLKTAQAPLISQALVMPITTPVPEEYAAPFDKSTPSKYDQYVAFSGPYMVRNDPKTGRATGRVAGKLIDIVRNPNWDPKTDFRPAYLDAIKIEEGNNDLATASRRVLNGSHMVCCDAGTPPAQVLKQALQGQKDQVAFVGAGGTRYIPINTRTKPFDNVNVRKALIAASNRDALRLTRGGKILGDIANGFIPPGIPGYEEAGGAKQNTDLDFLAHPGGDPALAKKYMLAAKEQDPSLTIDAAGKWTGGEKILMLATNADPGKKTAEVFQNQLEELGFKLNFRIVPQDTLYTKFYNVPGQSGALMPNASWFKDFSDPQAMLDPTFNGDRILEQGNTNWPQLDVPAINQAMKEAEGIPVGPDRNKAWAKINHMVAEQAAALPYLWDKSAAVGAQDVVQVISSYFTAHDLSFTSLK
jgi:peptide/nickel transport system substrate-binding protein